MVVLDGCITNLYITGPPYRARRREEGVSIDMTLLMTCVRENHTPCQGLILRDRLSRLDGRGAPSDVEGVVKYVKISYFPDSTSSKRVLAGTLWFFKHDCMWHRDRANYHN